MYLATFVTQMSSAFFDSVEVDTGGIHVFKNIRCRCNSRKEKNTRCVDIILKMQCPYTKRNKSSEKETYIKKKLLNDSAVKCKNVRYSIVDKKYKVTLKL